MEIFAEIGKNLSQSASVPIVEVETMRKDTVSNLLEKQETEKVAEKAVKNPNLLKKLFAGISSTNPKTKFGSAKTLRIISETNPQVLYSKVELFANLLKSNNTILKWMAIDVIANLTAVDTQNRFNGYFEKFYGCFHEGSLITASHVVDGSGKIALYKPELQDKITEELLKVEEVPLPTSECRNILIGKAINAFGAYYDKIEDRESVIAFVERQLNNSRHATKTKAEKFLKKFGKHAPIREK